MPATAARDNETLDHLLSFRCRDLIYSAPGAIRKCDRSGLVAGRELRDDRAIPRTSRPSTDRRPAPMPHAFATRRAVLMSLAALGCAASRPAWAQGYPSRTVRIVIPFGPGGVGDISIRIVADRLGEKFGRRFIIENVPSPDGIVAGRNVLSAAADGHTLLLLTGGTAAALALYNKYPLDVFNEL